MDLERLQGTYAPILHYSAGEQFYPLAVDDWLSYCALYRKGDAQPLIAPGRLTAQDLAQHRRGGPETFVRSVQRGPLWGRDVAAQWGGDTLKLLRRWAQMRALTPAQTRTQAWSEAIARRLYTWFSAKTAAATRYFWWTPLLAALADSPTHALPRFGLPDITRVAALERYQAFAGGAPPLSYYYRAVEQGHYLNLQYWFFYGYNDWANAFGGFNDHEGDWEGVQLFFDLDGGRRVLEPPIQVCFLGHHSRMVKAWDHPELHRSGTHVHAFIAAGSHASYPEPNAYDIMTLYNLVDRATGDARIIDHDDWQRRIDLDAATWIHTYGGSFGTRYWLSLDWLRGLTDALGINNPGEIELPGVSGPRSPRYADDGSERENWSRAAAFAGLLAPEQTE